LYLRGIDTTTVSLAINIPEPVIQKSDILSITVFSDNPEATALFNQVQTQSPGNASGASSSSGGVSATAGYLVDKKGDIYFHSLGLIPVNGLTKMQLTDTLKQKLSVYLKNPYVEIRFLNARVTMLGEIARPGTINIPEQRISILDAIALSGDLTGYGRRDNILVVREKDGKRETTRLDIRNPAIYQSDFFYLQQNDLVYVEPIQKKPTGSDQLLVRNVAIVTSIVSTVAILISIFQN
jgi:polysaccharide export outer membrane protein